MEAVGTGVVYGPYGPYAGAKLKRPYWAFKTNTAEQSCYVLEQAVMNGGE